MRRDDPFAGGVAPRLLRMDRELEAALLDAQSRDWAADRPDRVGFARLGQARHEVFAAARRYRALRLRPEPVLLALLGFGVFALLVGVSGAAAGSAVDPPVVGGAAVAGLWVAVAARAGLNLIRRERARRARAGAAPIDDAYLYAGLRRRIEACAVAARGERSGQRRAAAADLEYALDWLAAAQDELPRRT